MNTLATKKDDFRNLCHAYFLLYNKDTEEMEFSLEDDCLVWYLTAGDKDEPIDLGNDKMNTFRKSSRIIKKLYQENVMVNLEVLSYGMEREIKVTLKSGFSFSLPYSGDELEVNGKPYFNE